MCDSAPKRAATIRSFASESSRRFERAFERAAAQVRNTAGQTRQRADSMAGSTTNRFGLPRDEPCVVAAAAAVEAEGREPELAITNGGLDANWLTAHGIPTVTLGCGQRNIHTAREELDIAEFHLARRIALRLATAAESQ